MSKQISGAKIVHSDHRLVIVDKECGVGINAITKFLQLNPSSSEKLSCFFRGPVAKAMAGLVAVFRCKEALNAMPVQREYVAIVHGRVPRTISPDDTDSCISVESTTASPQIANKESVQHLKEGQKAVFTQKVSTDRLERTQVSVIRIAHSNSAGFITLVRITPLATPTNVSVPHASNKAQSFHREQCRELMYSLKCPVIGTIGRTRKLRSQKCSGVYLSCDRISFPVVGVTASIGSDECQHVSIPIHQRFKLLMDKEEEFWRRRQTRLRDQRQERACSGSLDNDTVVPHYGSTQKFMGLHFNISPAVMIPRPSSEILVLTARNVVKEKLGLLMHRTKSVAEDGRQHSTKSCCILDLGTGSGCLMLSCLHGFPNKQVYGVGVDLSADALQVAATNARKLGLEQRVSFVNCSFADSTSSIATSPSAKQKTFDICICNPPYLVRRHGLSVLNADVIKNEPGLALFVAGEDPLIHYRTVLGTVYDPYRQAIDVSPQTDQSNADDSPACKRRRPEENCNQSDQSIMRRGAKFLFEAPPYHMKQLIALLEKHNAQAVEVHEDSFGKPRCIMFS